MSKNAFFIGQPIFSQLIKLIPRSIIVDTVAEFESDRYVKHFMTYDHLVAMVYCCLMRCDSLRELTTGLQASMNRLSHLGLSYTPRRSTVSDANAKRPSEVFSVIFHRLVKRYYSVLPDSQSKKSFEDKLFIIDSTTVTLFSDIMKGAGAYSENGRKKGGAKAHVLLKANEDIPVFVMLTESKENDQLVMRYLPLPKGSFVVFDKAYANSRILHAWDEQGTTWVTRMRHGSSIRSITSLAVTEVQKSTGILNDQIVRMGRKGNKTTHILLVRLITYYDQEKKRVFEFLTNNFELEANQVAEIYKRRWQIELMFKRWKSNNPLKYFLGNNENAIKIQIWTSFIADLLIQIVRKQLKKHKSTWSFSNLAGLVRQHLFTYIDLMKFLRNPEKTLLQNNQNKGISNQLMLYETN